jgi:drug/metabolite transporter (DMT)-like permease
MNNIKGILLVIAAMAAFTIEDSFIKQLSSGLPVGQILVFLGGGGGLLFAGIARFKHQNLLARAAWKPLLCLRIGADTVAAMCFATALSLVDISTVAAVFQATPLVITMGAALFLGEQVGWRRWSAICVGFIGVLMIVRPGLAGFEPNALFVLVSVVGIAVRDLVTRLIDSAISSVVVSFQGCMSMGLAGVVLLIVDSGTWQPMEPRETWMIVAATLFGVVGYYGIVLATRIGDASVVTPFRYTRLLFSLLVGAFVFHERPDAVTLVGASLIIGTGLYTFVRERRLAMVSAQAAV